MSNHSFNRIQSISEFKRNKRAGRPRLVNASDFTRLQVDINSQSFKKLDALRDHSGMTLGELVDYCVNVGYIDFMDKVSQNV